MPETERFHLGCPKAGPKVPDPTRLARIAIVDGQSVPAHGELDNVDPHMHREGPCPQPSHASTEEPSPSTTIRSPSCAARCAASGVRCVVFGGRVVEAIDGVETVSLSGDPATAEKDLEELGRRLVVL